MVARIKISVNRMFILFHKSSDHTVDIEECHHISSDLTYLWHQRYGHLNYKGLKLLHTKEMVHGLPQLKTSNIICVDCFTGKQIRNTIPKKKEWRASKNLELVYTDICGQIKPISNSSKKYILCFIDDYIRKSWVFLLFEKSEALECFKNYKKMVEKEAEAPIKCLRSLNRGEEFNLLNFKSFCEDEGIKRHLTTTYTLHQNGVIERKNRTVMNMVHYMLAAKKIPKPFWDEAVN